MTGTCDYEKCSHSMDEHDEGICWHIVDFDADEKTQDVGKFCQCKIDSGSKNAEEQLIRRFNHPKMGYSEPGENDLMVTKLCAICNDEVVLLLNENMCMYCKDKPEQYHQ